MKEEHRGISYSVVRIAAETWEWSVSFGDPPVLKMGEATSEPRAVLRVRQMIDETLRPGDSPTTGLEDSSR